MIILDKETSGISPYINGALSLGAVDFQTGETFYGECRLTEGRVANQKALEINGFTPEQISDPAKQSDVQLYMSFVDWATSKDRGNVLGGHNIGHFDILFLEEIHTRSPIKDQKFPFSYRTVDLHTLGYQKFGISLSHEQVCVKLGLPPEPKPHNALEGALSELAAIKLLLS
jgi:DNA polymerase III alpha subunit (gram-positive type)